MHVNRGVFATAAATRLSVLDLEQTKDVGQYFGPKHSRPALSQGPPNSSRSGDRGNRSRAGPSPCARLILPSVTEAVRDLPVIGGHNGWNLQLMQTYSLFAF